MTFIIKKGTPRGFSSVWGLLADGGNLKNTPLFQDITFKIQLGRWFLLSFYTYLVDCYVVLYNMLYIVILFYCRYMQLIKRADFTRVFKLQRANVSVYLKKGGKFVKCTHEIDSKQYINVMHPLFISHYNQNLSKKIGLSLDEVIEQHNSLFLEISSSTEVEQKDIVNKNSVLDKTTVLTRSKIDALGHLTLQQVVEEYGSQYNFNLEMQGFKELLEVQKLANQVCKQRGELVGVELLTKTTKGYLDSLSTALLTDFTNWTVLEVAAITDCSKEKQLTMREKLKAELSRHLKATQNSIIKQVNKAQQAYA